MPQCSAWWAALPRRFAVGATGAVCSRPVRRDTLAHASPGSSASGSEIAVAGRCIGRYIYKLLGSRGAHGSFRPVCVVRGDVVPRSPARETDRPMAAARATSAADGADGANDASRGRVVEAVVEKKRRPRPRRAGPETGRGACNPRDGSWEPRRAREAVAARRALPPPYFSESSRDRWRATVESVQCATHPLIARLPPIAHTHSHPVCHRDGPTPPSTPWRPRASERPQPCAARSRALAGPSSRRVLPPAWKSNVS